MHPAVPSIADRQSMGPPVELVRVFFALSPGRRCVQRLQSLADDLALRFGGRAMQPETLHLTLAFLGDVGVDRLPVLLAMAAAVADDAWQWVPAGDKGGAARGVLRLDRLGYWGRQRLLWAGSASFPPTLRVLAGQLAERTRVTGIAVPRSPFVPHVTLVRKVDRAPAALPTEFEAGGEPGFNLEPKPESKPVSRQDSRPDWLENPLHDSPISWPWRDFVLLCSRRSAAGASYERLGRWRVRAG